MFKFIDSILDKVNMYRLVLYYLIFLLAAAIGLSLSGQLHYSPVTIGFSSIYLVTICYVSNKIFAYVYDVPTNVESVYITALILALIITPVTTAFGVLFLTAAGGLHGFQIHASYKQEAHI